MPTLSIDLTNQQAQRVAAAIGSLLGLGRDATVAEVRDYIVAHLRAEVRRGEVSAAQSAPDIDVA